MPLPVKSEGVTTTQHCIASYARNTRALRTTIKIIKIFVKVKLKGHSNKLVLSHNQLTYSCFTISPFLMI